MSTSNDEPRMRTYEWTDPTRIAEKALSMSGQEFFASWQDGDVVPPICATLGFDVVDYGDGYAEVACAPQEYHYNPIGTAHGGLAATLIDTATGVAVHTQLPRGSGYTTLSTNVSFLRPITKDTGITRTIGRVVSMGRRVAVAEAEVLDADDRILARGSSTCLILSP